MKRLVIGALALVAGCLIFDDPDADADPGIAPLPTPPGVGSGGGSGEFGGSVAGEPGIGGGPNLSPVAASALFLCPGVGVAVNVLGGGGGYCDFDFTEVKLPGPPGFGVMHIHCEFGGFAPVAASWQCWRVFPGRSDHPALPDPDIVPDNWTVPWALSGPTPNDQWPPLGLTPPPPPGAPPPDAPPPPP